MESAASNEDLRREWPAAVTLPNGSTSAQIPWAMMGDKGTLIYMMSAKSHNLCLTKSSFWDFPFWSFPTNGLTEHHM